MYFNSHVSFGCGGERHCGPTATELPGLIIIGAHKRRRQQWYFLDEEWSEGSTGGKPVSGAAGGKLGRGQLHLPQKGWITPQSHCGPDKRGWDQEKKDSCEKGPRYILRHCTVTVSQQKNISTYTWPVVCFCLFVWFPYPHAYVPVVIRTLFEVLCSKLEWRVPLLLDLAQQSRWQSGIHQSSTVSSLPKCFLFYTPIITKHTELDFKNVAVQTGKREREAASVLTHPRLTLLTSYQLICSKASAVNSRCSHECLIFFVCVCVFLVTKD